MPFMPCIITSQSTRLNCSLGGMTTFSRSSCRLSSPPPAHCRRAQTGERGWGGWRRLGGESQGGSRGRARRRRQARRHAKVTAAAELRDDRGREGVVLDQQDLEALDLDLIERHGLLLLDLQALPLVLVLEGVRLGDAGHQVHKEQVRVVGKVTPAAVALDGHSRAAREARGTVGDAPRLELPTHDLEQLGQRHAQQAAPKSLGVISFEMPIGVRSEQLHSEVVGGFHKCASNSSVAYDDQRARYRVCHQE